MKVFGTLLAATAVFFLGFGIDSSEARKRGSGKSRSKARVSHVTKHSTRINVRVPVTIKRQTVRTPAPAPVATPAPQRVRTVPSANGIAFPAGAIALCNDGRFVVKAEPAGVCATNGGVKAFRR